jgi:glutaredoxin
MNPIPINGNNSPHLFLYALSTCVWCRKTKRLLDELGFSYEHIDVDLQSAEDQGVLCAEIERWNPEGTYPTLVVDNSYSINGYKPEKLQQLAQKP